MTDNGRQSQVDGAGSEDKHSYKGLGAGRDTRHRPATIQLLDIFSLKRVAFYTVSIMVSTWFIVKLFVAFAPLTSVAAQYPTLPILPQLLDATADELISGLEAGDFTSVDLVQVSFRPCTTSCDDVGLPL